MPSARLAATRHFVTRGARESCRSSWAAVVRVNGLSDGNYIEPYAGGAGIAWELLITGVVRRVLINGYQSTRVRLLDERA